MRRDGSEVPIEIGLSPLKTPDGDFVLSSVVDITERKHAETAIELLRAEREANLKTSVAVRDDFIAIAGHELNSPLAALLIQLESLQRAVRKDPAMDTGARLEKAVGSAHRLGRLVEQLLDVSRITSGRLRLESEPVDLSWVVKEIVARCAEMTDRRPSIVLRCEGQLNGYWDRLRIEQVVSNLVGNALKYGQGKPVEVDLRMDEGEAVLRVIDHGIGIDEEHQKKIFQRFERAVVTRDFGGFGLGLWITRQIVEVSGGRIDVESAPGQGSTFTVRLPIERNQPACPCGRGL